jgi:polysaccharide biosynthesis protein PslH
MTAKPRLLIVSAVLPFPRKAGQNQRVYYKIKAAREHFHVTFLTFTEPAWISEVRAKLLEVCDDAIILPGRYASSRLSRLSHKARGTLFSLKTGLKFSNYVTGELEFTPSRIAALLTNQHFDCALFEYWHAHQTIPTFHTHNIPCVLDMHDVLWQSYSRQLSAKRGLPAWWRDRAIKLYQQTEEYAWQQFDALIAINAAEGQYARGIVRDHIPIFYTPMGTDLSTWPYSWEPAEPPRIGYYASMSSPHNQQDALHCFTHIMPLIWDKIPNAELWLVGSNPPDFIQALPQKDSRIHVTGFVDRVQDVLKTMSAVLCPWSGTYGFRSRLIEVMGLGVPIVASPDAVYGMNMTTGQGIFLSPTDEGLAQYTLDLVCQPAFAQQQSKLARAQMEQKFSYEATYGQFATDLLNFVANR